MNRVACIVAATLLASPALAWNDLERMTAAQAIGSVLASEEFCELAYNHAAIAAHIENSVPADDMQFAGMLQLMTDGSRFELEGMSGSQKAAHCTQTRRVAASFGFID